MARHESDREDLLEEATALVRRAEIVGPISVEPVVVGFRKDGGLSVYFGADPVYHLDPDGRLKRAYRSGRLYRTQGDTLAELTRERTPTETVLLRRDLTQQDLESFLSEMAERITTFVMQHRSGEVRIERQIPESDERLWTDFEVAVSRMNDRRRDGTPLAPRFKGKR